MRRTLIYVPGSSQNHSGPKPCNDAFHHPRKEGENNERKKKSNKPSSTTQVAVASENSSSILKLSHKESAQGNSMMMEFEKTLKKIDEELGLNSETEYLVSIPVPVDAQFEIPVARDSVSHTIFA